MAQPSWLERGQLLTLKQAAEILDVPTEKLDRIISSQRLRWVRSIIGAKCRIHPQDLYDYMLTLKFFPNNNLSMGSKEQHQEELEIVYRELETSSPKIKDEVQTANQEQDSLKEEVWLLVDAFLKRAQTKIVEQNDEVDRTKYKAIADAYNDLNTIYLSTKNELEALKEEHERLKEASHKLEQKVAEIQIELSSSVKVDSIEYEAATEILSPERSELQEVVNHQPIETFPEAGDSAPTAVKEPISSQPKRKGIAPIKRGGKPRDTAPEPKRQKAQEHKPLLAKPEVICWSRQRHWCLGIEVPEEFLDKYEVEVFQNESLLEQDESADNRWLLEQPAGRVKAQWTEAGTANETAIELEGEPCFIFKLSGSDQEFGRRIRTPSSGLHLVAVPESWKCDEEASTEFCTYLGNSYLAEYHT